MAKTSMISRTGTVILALLVVGAMAPAASQTTLVPSGATWKYLDDGSDQGTAWRGLGFDDSSWMSGPAQLGYGDGDESTVVGYGPDPAHKYITTYFRQSLTVADPSQYESLSLRVLRDDGAVAYINGTEVARSNMPIGTIYPSTRAGDSVGGVDEDRYFDYFVEPNVLIAGTNVLAVEIHQISDSNSDISFDLELLGLADVLHPIRKGPRLIYPGVNTEMKVVWQLGVEDTCTIEWGDDESYGIGSAQTVEYGSIHQHAHVITDLAPATKYYYRVIVKDDTLTGSFWTAPESDATSVKFIAYGDTRTYPADHDSVAQGIINTYTSDPAYQSAVICVGDLVGVGENEDDWQYEFFDPFYTNIQTMLANVPYQACMGNHEGDGVLFSEYFPYPFVNDRYWAFDYGPVHFIVVDQYVNCGPGSPQLIWLENELATSAKRWKIIYLHEPGWSAGGHGNKVSVQQYIQPLCEEYNVKFIFAGHNHYYARCTYNGVQHITTGGGGAPLRTPSPSYPCVQFCAEAYHFCKVEITGGLLKLTAVGPDGTVLETITENALRRAHAVAPATTTAPTTAALSAYPAFPNPFRSTATIPFSIQRAADVVLNVYDVGGRRIRAVRAGRLGAGGHELLWDGRRADGRHVGPGLYFYELRAGHDTQSGRMVLVGRHPK